MGESREIQCICKNNRYNPSYRITHVGGTGADGRRWMLSQREAIQGIETGKWRFYVRVDEARIWVVVAFNTLGELYLKTENDVTEPSNLLNLPECP